MKRRTQRMRRGMQLALAVLFLGAPLANAAGVTWLFATGVSLRVGPVELLEPASALSAALAARALPPQVALGAAPFVVLLALLGSVFCGWACPWGLVSELLDVVRPDRARRTWAPGTMQRARRVRLALLGLLLAGSLLSAVPLAALLAGPRLATSAALELGVLGTLGSTTAVLLGGLLLLELLGPRRLWCRALCPVGGLAATLRTRWTARVVREGDCTCTRTPACQSVCPWGLDPRAAGWADGCTSCLACTAACPARVLRLRPTPHPGALIPKP